MQKVEGSSPFSRFGESPANAGLFHVPYDHCLGSHAPRYHLSLPPGSITTSTGGANAGGWRQLVVSRHDGMHLAMRAIRGDASCGLRTRFMTRYLRAENHDLSTARSGRGR